LSNSGVKGRYLCEKQHENREKRIKKNEKSSKINGFLAADFYGGLVKWAKFDDWRRIYAVISCNQLSSEGIQM